MTSGAQHGDCFGFHIDQLKLALLHLIHLRLPRLRRLNKKITGANRSMLTASIADYSTYKVRFYCPARI